MNTRPTAVALLGCAVALLGCAAAQAQQLYRWVDKDGGVHYTQQPPPADARDVQRRKLSPGAAEPAGLPYAAQLAARNYPVTLFSSPDCGQPCTDARASLQKRGIPFQEIVVGDPKSLAELKRISSRLQVPVLRVGAQVSIGFEAEAWKTALDIAGYPASLPPTRARIEGAAPKAPPPVQLYTNASCGGLCDEARKVLAARRVAFQEIEVTRSTPETIDELRRVSGGESVPVLVVGGRAQPGFDAALYHKLLDAAGFPRAAAAK